MQAPEFPQNEAQRMAGLNTTDALFTPAEERFDRITRLASQMLDVPIALVSLVAECCQWFKSSYGLDASETPREISFCGYAILNEGTFVVEDAARDERFFDNPLVTGAPNIRFYAGHPLHSVDGSRVGTLCVIDRRPRVLSAAQLQILRDLAAIAETELQRGQLSESQRLLIRECDDLKRKASIDGLTRLWNRAAITELLAAEMARAKRGVPLCVAMVDVDHFKSINDTHGHLVGDAVLVEIAARIRRALREIDAVGRYGGEEFIAVLSNCEVHTAEVVCERIRRSIESEKFATSAGPLAVTVSVGIAFFDAQQNDFEHIVGAADAALYRAKNKGRNRVEIDGAPDR